MQGWCLNILLDDLLRKVVQTKLFARLLKKTHPNEKKAIDRVVKKILSAPEKGDRKKGNLAGVYTQTFSMHGAQFRLAYRFDKTTIELISFGPRENFYE